MSRREARASTYIAASMAEVWAVLTDFPRYREWNPFLVSAVPVGEFAVGSDIMLHVRWPTGGGARARDRFTAIAPPAADTAVARLDWHFVGTLALLGLLEMRRCQTITPEGDGVRYDTWERGSGPLSAFAPFRRIEAGFARHAEALKQRCERRAHQRAAS